MFFLPTGIAKGPAVEKSPKPGDVPAAGNVNVRNAANGTVVVRRKRSHTGRTRRRTNR